MAEPDAVTELDLINALQARVPPDGKGYLSTLVWNVRNAYLMYPEGHTDNVTVRWIVEGFLDEIRQQRDRGRAIEEENARLAEALDEARLRSIEARNPGIDIEEVKRLRAERTP